MFPNDYTMTIPDPFVATLCLFVVCYVVSPSAQADEKSDGRSGVDIITLAAELDGLYARRDVYGFSERNRLKIDEALKAAADEYEILWRGARWYVWVAEGASSREERERAGRHGWDLGDRATTIKPGRPEGWYYAALALGSYYKAAGVLSAVFSGGPKEFLQRLQKAEQFGPNFDGAGPAVVLGRYYFELPWPQYDGALSIEWLKKALAREPKKARAHYYLAETYIKENKSKEAAFHLDQCLSIPPGTLDAPEERLIHVLAGSLKKKLQKDAR